MIAGKLDEIKRSTILNERILSKLDLLDRNFTNFAPGRYEVDDRSFFFLNEYETREEEHCFWEAHKKYIDVHYILEGQEKIALENTGRQQIKVEYNSEKDAIFFEGDVRSAITMNPGDVLICLPEDSHMTGLIAGEIQKVRKIVLKVEL